MTWLLKRLFALGINIICVIFSGKIISLMWAWFLVPVFPNAPELDTMHAVGLSFLVSYPIVMSKTSGELDKEISKSKPNDDGSENWMKKNDYVIRPICFILFVYPLYLLWTWAFHHVIN